MSWAFEVNLRSRDCGGKQKEEPLRFWICLDLDIGFFCLFFIYFILYFEREEGGKDLDKCFDRYYCG